MTASATANNKVYNAGTDATVTISLAGKVGTEDVTASGTGVFANKNVGTGKTVSVSGITLAGADAGNYTVASTTTTTADITSLGITGSITASDKVFDGATTATILTRTLTGVLGADDVTYVGGTANFDTAAVGNNKTVTATGLSLSGVDARTIRLTPQRPLPQHHCADGFGANDHFPIDHRQTIRRCILAQRNVELESAR